MDFDYNTGGSFDGTYYPPLRPLSDAIRKQNYTTNSEFIIYEPGNGTRYEVLLSTYNTGYGVQHNINLVNFRTSMIIVGPMGLSSLGYMEEKLCITRGDCYALIPLINDYLVEAGQ